MIALRSSGKIPEMIKMVFSLCAKSRGVPRNETSIMFSLSEKISRLRDKVS